MRPIEITTLSIALALALPACKSGSASIEVADGQDPGAGAQLEPPRAKRILKRLEAHGDVRVDPYYWLRERENPLRPA